MFKNKFIYSLLALSLCAHELAASSTRMLVQSAVTAAKKVTIKKAAAAALVTAAVGVGVRRYAHTEIGKKQIDVAKKKYNQHIAPVLHSIRPHALVGIGVGTYLFYRGYKGLLMNLGSPKSPEQEKVIKTISGIFSGALGGICLSLELGRAIDLAQMGKVDVTGTTLNDYKGTIPAAVEQLIKQINEPARFANIRKDKKISYSGGLILYGGPGTGKTYLAKAMAGSLGVPFYELSIANVKRSEYGGAERQIRAWFDYARSMAAKHPKKVAILFMDEIDALGQSRDSEGSATATGSVHLINVLLAEIDGFTKHDAQVIVIGATNRPKAIDAGLVRSGRLELVAMPSQTAEGAKAIFNHYLSQFEYEHDADQKRRDAFLQEIAQTVLDARRATPATLKDIIMQAGAAAIEQNKDKLTDALIKRCALQVCQAHVVDSAELKISAQSRITFADVAGGVPPQLAMLADQVKNPDKYRHTNYTSGILLHGLPRTGKTYLVKALAGELGVSFFNLTIADVRRKWHGDSESRIQEIFKQARQAANTHPRRLSILFIDELDALGLSRNQLSYRNGVSELQMLLTEIDGLREEESGHVLVIGATNNYGAIDPALIDAGRLETVIEIKPLDKQGCLHAFAYYLSKHHVEDGADEKRSSALQEELTDIVFGNNVRRACTPALIKRIVEEAARYAAQAGHELIKRDDLVTAARAILNLR